MRNNNQLNMDIRIPNEIRLDDNVAENFKIFLVASHKWENSAEQQVVLLLNVIGDADLKLLINFQLSEIERKD